MSKESVSEFTDLTYVAASSGLLCEGPFVCSSSIVSYLEKMYQNVVFAQGLKVLVPKQQKMINLVCKTYNVLCEQAK